MSRPQAFVALAAMTGVWLLAAETMGAPRHGGEFLAPELAAYFAPPRGNIAPSATPLDEHPDTQAAGQPDTAGQQANAADPDTQVQILMLTRMD